MNPRDLVHDPLDHRRLESRCPIDSHYLQLLADGICKASGTYLNLLPSELVEELRKIRGRCDPRRWIFTANFIGNYDAPAAVYYIQIESTFGYRQLVCSRMETLYVSRDVFETTAYKELIERILHRRPFDQPMIVSESRVDDRVASYDSLDYDHLQDELVIRYCRRSYISPYTLHLPVTDDLLSALGRASQKPYSLQHDHSSST